MSTMSAAPSTVSGGKHPAKQNKFAMASTAFLAILRRDILVTVRGFIAFLLQVFLQPLFYLFIFGAVLPKIGIVQHGYGALLFPGIVTLAVFLAAAQGVMLPLVMDLGYTREIDDRLLAPLPISLVVIEKVFFAILRGLVSGIMIFPLAYWILGSEYQVRTDAIGIIIGVVILTAFTGATVGLIMGTLVPPEQISLLFALVFTPLLFTGCLQYPWASLDTIKWFQILTLFNPLTYSAEGLRYAMVPSVHGQALSTLWIGWSLLGLLVTCILFFTLGVRSFYKRAIN